MKDAGALDSLELVCINGTPQVEHLRGTRLADVAARVARQVRLALQASPMSHPHASHTPHTCTALAAGTWRPAVRLHAPGLARLLPLRGKADVPGGRNL